MNRSLKLSMLIALALGTSQAMAMDMGQVQIKSALGQPLLAEIPLHPDNAAELQNLQIRLASSEQFARAGIVGGRTSIPLTFSVANAGGSHPVIRITSTAPIDDPFLDLLIEVNGKAGTSVREYAILLDPPNAQTKAAVAATPAPAQPAQRPKPAATAPVAAAQPKPVAAAPAPKASAAVPNDGQIGTVSRGQTLSGIARDAAPAGVDVQQMMLAIKQANPDAFYRDNINALKTGAVLRMPSTAEAQAMTIAAAVAEVRRQNSDWRAGVPGKPTVVADAAARTAASAAPTSAADTGDRLALVPAKQGSGSSSQGAGSNDKSSASLRQDLLRSKESLASLQQQSSDLKTRLKDLGDINSKNERLLSLKDSEIAELQAKLAAAQKNAGAKVAPAAAASAVKPAATPAVAVVPVEKEPARAGTVANAANTPVVATVTPAAASTAASTPVSAATAVVAPVPVVVPAKPVVKPATKSAVKQPMATPAAVEEQPWFMQTWAWAAGAGVAVLLILLAMLGRRRKPAAAAAPKASSSLADRFGSANGGAGHDLLGDDTDQDELLDQLAEHPDDIYLHLELVTLYYSRRDVEHFEAAAEAMHAHITDPQQDEWQDVVHMGEDLAPGHPLFDHHEEPAAHADDEGHGAFNIDDYSAADDAPTVVSSMPPLPGAGPKKVSEYNFNFDLTHPAPDAPASAPVATAPEDVTVVAPLAAEPTEPVSSWNFDESTNSSDLADDGEGLGNFSDDPVDTKLDLARAYVDMGDAEGARAMLGEVIKEGSQTQQDAAKRLLDSLA
ncbi:fimbrial protein FimV [Rhodanobacter sp. AS-Z3]|uniref:FimV/HubP family polar landmark protein n=1 Tax=Rhodanobacter sp. AS-Z3 TaxID=3031330 RepID=UPI00247ACBC8|nr:FimV/HubP family polar landmark protein [Rhodanobacter sp. AS-Z3]WEN16774.1 fimbrial protein FimV [Rhodanobacter sp. AS-Z3]